MCVQGAAVVPCGQRTTFTLQLHDRCALTCATVTLICQSPRPIAYSRGAPMDSVLVLEQWCGRFGNATSEVEGFSHGTSAIDAEFIALDDSASAPPHVEATPSDATCNRPHGSIGVR